MMNHPRRLLILLALGTLVLAGCGNMWVQPKLDEPYDDSPTFGTAARELDENAVSRGFEYANSHLYAGVVDGDFATTFPIEITRDTLDRGQDLYDAFCSPCHGLSGYGNGIVVAEGLRSQSYHSDRLRNAPVGYFYQTIVEGYGNMYSYASRIKPEDRWAVVAYIRALQLSQYAALDELPEAVQAEFEALNQ